MVDLESQVSGVTEDLPTSITANSQLPRCTDIAAHQPRTSTVNSQITNPTHPRISDSADSQPQNNDPHENTPSETAAGDPDSQQGEKYGDSSDGVWSMYLTGAKKQDNDVTESWKGDTDGILIFTGLFSATVASFIIESYKNLSPNSSDTTNALLTQITQQLVNISNGTPLTSAAAKTNQPFKPTVSAVRVNVLWFLSLVLSLTCALSATLMQQWARRYQELAHHTGAPHKCGRIRARIFHGIRRFGMARAIATMPLLLHASVFLFFAGLIDFLFPINKTVSYTTLACVVAFALAYAILTILPNLYFDCPYATPLSGVIWRLSQVFVIVGLKAALGIENLLHHPLLKLRSRFDRHITTGLRVQTWKESLKSQVNVH
ncbi:hypothetical protein EI94DRAFT_368278 [Lactarius quietus]|nr:hypothetical protein EI94DRAFT_368278 [Lactarius quietus]